MCSVSHTANALSDDPTRLKSLSSSFPPEEEEKHGFKVLWAGIAQLV